MPTVAQIKAEIEDQQGPLFAQYAPHWADFFDDTGHPKWDDLACRQGLLKPDAALAIYRLMTASGRTRQAPHVMPKGQFMLGIAPAVLSLAAKDEATQKKWDRVLGFIEGAEETVSVGSATVQAILDSAVSEGLLTTEQRAIFPATVSASCSRSEELGWGQGWDYDLISTARR